MVTKKRKTKASELEEIKEDLEDLETYITEYTSFLPLPVCTLSAVGIIIEVNKALEGLVDHRAMAIIARPIEELFFDKKKIKRLLKRAQRKGLVRGEEMVLRAKGEREVFVSVSVSSRKDGEGNLIGYFLALTEITKIKKLQGRLEQKTKELEQKVRALERFNKLAVGRELKMVQLKREVERLRERFTKEERS